MTTDYIKALRRIQELEKMHPENKGKYIAKMNCQIGMTSSMEYSIYLFIEQTAE